MPFCTQCGTQVATTAKFCGRCGQPQPLTDASGSGTGPAFATGTGPTGTGTGPVGSGTGPTSGTGTGPQYGSGTGPTGTGPIPRRDDGPFAGVSARTASTLCYIPVVGWVAAVVALATPKFQYDQQVRFHAFQGIYLFVFYLLVNSVVVPFFGLMPGDDIARIMRGLLRSTVFIAWIVMLVKTSQNEMLRLPILGELAERSMAEQR
jgi:uncharacterized membrane protein